MATQPQAETLLPAEEPLAAEREGAPLAGEEQREGAPLKRAPSAAAADALVAGHGPEAPPWWRVATDRINGDLLPFGAAVPEPWDYRPVPPFVVDEDGHLIDDARPMNPRHAKRMLAYGTVLQAHYRDRGALVGVDLLMPYVQGSPGKVVAPDLLVALAAREREERNSFKLWEEPVPDLVLEDLSPSNWRVDAVDKRRLYRRLGVREYWLFDETAIRLRDVSGARLGEVLVGYRLRGNGYTRIRASATGRLPSAVLGLELCVRDGLLRFFDPTTGEYLRILEEERAQRMAAERRAAEERRERAAAQARIAELEAKLRAQHGSD